MPNNIVSASATGLSSRRTFLTAGPAVASLHEAIAAEAPDAELIALGRKFDAAWAHERLMNKEGSDCEFSAACDKTREIAQRIRPLPVKTIDGLKIKARVVNWCHDGDFDGFNYGDTTDLSLAEQIIRDLLAL